MNWQHIGWGLLITIVLICFNGTYTLAFGEVSQVDKKKNAFISESVLSTFLEESNQSQVGFVSQLIVKQAGQEKTLYFQIGNEERRRKFNKRPILMKTMNSAPFIREVVYITRVSRSQPIDIEFTMGLVQHDHAGEIVKIYPEYIFVDVNPSKHDLEKHETQKGCVNYHISQGEKYHDIRFQIRGETNHEVQLIFMNEKKPFTLTHKKEQ